MSYQYNDTDNKNTVTTWSYVSLIIAAVGNLLIDANTSVTIQLTFDFFVLR